VITKVARTAKGVVDMVFIANTNYDDDYNNSVPNVKHPLAYLENYSGITRTPRNPGCGNGCEIEALGPWLPETTDIGLSGCGSPAICVLPEGRSLFRLMIPSGAVNQLYTHIPELGR
jgi:hypothetical protein